MAYHVRIAQKHKQGPLSNGGVTIDVKPYKDKFIVGFARCSLKDRYSKRDPKVYRLINKRIKAVENMANNLGIKKCKATETVHTHKAFFVNNKPSMQEVADLGARLFRMDFVPEEEYVEGAKLTDNDFIITRNKKAKGVKGHCWGEINHLYKSEEVEDAN